MTGLVLLGCGSSDVGQRRQVAQVTSATTTAPLPKAHPQVVEPTAGDPGVTRTSAQVPQPQGAPAAPKPGGPLAPASATSAPAAGAPTDAEVRQAIARFQLAVAKYHLDQLNLAGALLNPAQLPPGQYNVSIASVYTDYGLPVACGGVLKVPELGVANKTLPCGTEVIFVYGKRAVRVPVIDRGPYIAGRTWDLTGATAEALHFPGLGPIRWRLG